MSSKIYSHIVPGARDVTPLHYIHSKKWKTIICILYHIPETEIAHVINPLVPTKF